MPARKMHWLIWLLGSAWFLPVSCTALLGAGTGIVAQLDARHAEAGDAMHSAFSVVVEPSDGTDPFIVLPISALGAGPARPDSAAFRMSRPEGEIRDARAIYSYRVLEQTQDTQLIEVVERRADGDNMIWSRYRVTRHGVEPVSSRMFYFGYLFAAFPYALGLALFVYGAARVTGRRLAPIMDADDPGATGS